MKQLIMKRLLIAGIAIVTVPGTLLAQKEKDKEKEKKEVQQITITRTGDLNEKTVIEIDGDKVKVNGKDVKDDKNVNVHVNNLKGATGYRFKYDNGSGGYGVYNDGFSMFREDENVAMLGVVTEGDDKGAEIQSITKESGADKAGLKKGDIITKIGDKKIESTDDVTEAVRAHKPGDKVAITYLREGKEQKATAELTKWKGIKMNAATLPRVNAMEQWREIMPTQPSINMNGNFYLAGRPKLGLSIQDTDDGVGVKVLDVDDDSNAAKAGLKKDDIIVGIDDHEVKGTDDVTRITREKNKYTFTFKVKRDGKTQNIEVKMPRNLKTADL
jgi:serine protease Do